MSENQLVQETEDLQSAEDKFFGVKTTFNKKNLSHQSLNLRL